MPKPKRKDVHLVFRGHAGTDAYRDQAISSKNRVFIVEQSGAKHGFRLDELFVEKPIASRRIRSQHQLLRRYLEQGGMLVSGELPKNKAEKKRLDELRQKAHGLKSKILEKPELRTIKSYFRAQAKFTDFRHELIKRKIKEFVERGETPVEAQYGQAHSVLSRELRQKGIETSREIEPWVHWLDSQVTRLIRIGKEPSNLDYKKGFVCMMDYNDKGMVRTIIGKKPEKVTSRDWQWFTVVESTLMNRLSESQVNRIIRERNPRLLFTLNGLSEMPTRKQLREFLEKHSLHYKRKMERKKRK